MPERAKMRRDDADGFRGAWEILERLWEGTLARARTLPEGLCTAAWVLKSLTDEQLASDVTRTEPGWPKAEHFPFKECLLIVLNEEWEHRRYAERDLAVLENESCDHLTR